MQHKSFGTSELKNYRAFFRFGALNPKSVIITEEKTYNTRMRRKAKVNIREQSKAADNWRRGVGGGGREKEGGYGTGNLVGPGSSPPPYHLLDLFLVTPSITLRLRCRGGGRGGEETSNQRLQQRAKYCNSRKRSPSN